MRLHQRTVRHLGGPACRIRVVQAPTGLRGQPCVPACPTVALPLRLASPQPWAAT